jgi:hypothetical protein
MFAGAVLSEEEFLLIVLLSLLAMAVCVLAGFLVGQWWVVPLGLLPLTSGGFRALSVLLVALLALGVGAAKRRRLWLRRRGDSNLPTTRNAVDGPSVD